MRNYKSRLREFVCAATILAGANLHPHAAWAAANTPADEAAGATSDNEIIVTATRRIATRVDVI